VIIYVGLNTIAINMNVRLNVVLLITKIKVRIILKCVFKILKIPFVNVVRLRFQSMKQKGNLAQIH